MRATSLFLATALGASSALAQSVNQTYVAGLINALNGLGLTSLVTVATKVAGTPQGQQLLAGLSTGTPFTVFAPTNVAFSGVNPYFGNDTNWLTQALAYHIIPGTVPTSGFAQAPQVSTYPTLLKDPSLVHLLGNKSQTVGLTTIDGKPQIARQNTPAVVGNSTTYENLQIYTLGAVIDLPPSANYLLTDPTGISGVPANYSLKTLSNLLGSQIAALAKEPSLTLFAPIDQAFIDAQAKGYISPSTNASTIQKILLNHIINGTVVTTGKPQTNYISAGGEEITVGTGGLDDGSGSVVYYRGQQVANIVYGDIPVQNGIVHLIDVVLPQTGSDSNRARQAYSSYSVGATSTSSGSAAKRTLPPSRFFRA